MRYLQICKTSDCVIKSEGEEVKKVKRNDHQQHTYMHRSAKKNSDMGDANVKVGRAGGGGAGAF